MTVHIGAVNFGGAGNLSADTHPQRQRISVLFQGSGSLSAVDTIIQMQVSILSTSLFQANADRGLAEMVGDPKVRLVLAVEIDLLPIS
jgi:hypothetical protein